MQTVLSVQNFILAMVLYPEVQNRAYTEIDHVIGRDRLPEFTDRDSLPYITAVAKEVLRQVMSLVLIIHLLEKLHSDGGFPSH